MALEKPRSVAYTIIRLKSGAVSPARDILRDSYPDAYIRRVFNPDQRLVVTLQPPSKKVFLDAVRDLLLLIDRVPGIVDSSTHIGELVAGSLTEDLARDRGCSWTLFRTDPRITLTRMPEVMDRFDRIDGVDQVAQLAGRFDVCLFHTFPKNDVGQLVRSQTERDETVAGIGGDTAASAVALRPVRYDELLCEVCP